MDDRNHPSEGRDRPSIKDAGCGGAKIAGERETRKNKRLHRATETEEKKRKRKRKNKKFREREREGERRITAATSSVNERQRDRGFQFLCDFAGGRKKMK